MIATNLPQRIALVTQEYPPHVRGGTGTSAHLLAHNLRSRGLSVDVYILSDRDEMLSERNAFTAANDCVRFLRDPFGIGGADPFYATWGLSALRLARLLRRYDLVHVYGASISPVMSIVRWLMRFGLRADVPMVLHMNYDLPACPFSANWGNSADARCSLARQYSCARARLRHTSYARRLDLVAPFFFALFWVQRFCVQQMPHLLTVSDNLRDLYIAHGFRPARLRNVGSPYDPAFAQAVGALAPDAPSAQTLSDAVVPPAEDEVNILYVGRLNVDKNVQELIRAFALVDDPRARLWIVGGGTADEQAALHGLVDELGVADRVRFWGRVPYGDLPAIYDRAHIFVHPGKWAEPFARICLEAMVAAKALVVSNVGSNPEAVGEAGIVYPVGDVAHLGQVLAELVADGGQRERLGRKARQRALHSFSPNRITDNITNIYANLNHRTNQTAANILHEPL